MIRPYTPADYDGITRVCLLTAEAGGDATSLYSSDELMPDIFARPYVTIEPDLAFVVDDGDVSGYILGTANTRSFVERYSADWLPSFAEKYEHIEPWTTQNEMITHLGFWPERMLLPEVDEYPAHFHIDVLPHLQGQGIGRELIATLADALRERGIPAVHLTMNPLNTGARAFYDRLGFHELPSSTPDSPRLGLQL